MKPKKRYNRPFEVTADILKLKRSAKEKIAAAGVIEREVRGYRDQANLPETASHTASFLIKTADYEHKKAIKLRRSVELIEEKRIPQLIHTLQELNTIPMEFIRHDPSVVKAES